MNLYLDGSWLARGIGGTGVQRFSAELNDATLELLRDRRTPVVPRVFSIGSPVEPAFRRDGTEYAVVPWSYRAFLYATAVFGAPELGARLAPPPDALQLHDAVRFGGGQARRCVVTVHDLAALREPGTYPARAAWLRRRSLARLRASTAIVHALSESTRADVIELGRIPAGQVFTVHPGVAPVFFTPLPAAEIEAVRTRWSLDRPFVLAVGAQHARKNLAFLVECFRDLARGRADDVLLVLVGPGSRAYVDTLCRRAGYSARERARVRFLGPLPDHELRACLQTSACFAFPSLYEGFGLPALEAMASGTPVIATNRSSLPEVVGDGGLLLDPHDRDAWVAAFETILDSPATAGALAERGRARARRFSWTATARRLLALMDVTVH